MSSGTAIAAYVSLLQTLVKLKSRGKQHPVANLVQRCIYNASVAGM